MCVYIYIYTHIYMYVCVYIYICNNTHSLTYTHTHTHTCPTYERLPYYSRAFPRPLFLGVFAKLRKRLLSSLYTSVRPSVRMEQLSSYWTDFHDMFSKICQENSSSIKIWHEYCAWRLTDGCDNISLNSSIMRNFSEKNCRENKTYDVFLITFFENCAVYEIIW